MYIELIEILRCPSCEGQFRLKEVNKVQNEEIIDATVVCEHGHEYMIIDGVLDFGSKEQELTNNWSSYYDEMKYEELDRSVEGKTPENLKALYDKAKEYILDDLNKSKPKTVLDMASGRGMLATYIAEHLEYSPMLILTDLSFQVLKYDRIKIIKNNPNLKVNYIACDCTHLPIVNGSIDTVISFFGITNMCDASKEGIEEGYRVLKDDGRLLNSVFYIDCDTEAAKGMAKAFREQLNINVFSEILSADGLDDAHRAGGFGNLKTEIIGEGTGAKNELDAIPIEGEWFAIAVINGTK